MQRLHYILLSIIIQLGVVITLAVLLYKEITLLHFINMLFYFVITHLLLWLSFVILKGGFFDGVTYGFRKVRESVLKKSMTIEWEDKPLPSNRVYTGFVPFFRFQAIVLGSILLILLGLYYL